MGNIVSASTMAFWLSNQTKNNRKQKKDKAQVTKMFKATREQLEVDKKP